MSFSGVIVWNETQTASSRIWTLVTDFISGDDSRYANRKKADAFIFTRMRTHSHTHTHILCLSVCLSLCKDFYSTVENFRHSSGKKTSVTKLMEKKKKKKYKKIPIYKSNFLKWLNNCTGPDSRRIILAYFSASYFLILNPNIRQDAL